MLVCAYYCAFGTRDRGCSRHPAFPAPSAFKRANEFAKLGRNHAARTRTYALSPRRPGLEPGPIRRGGNCLEKVVDGFASTIADGGYGSRRSPGRQGGKSAVGIGTPCPLLVLDVRGNRCSA